MIVLCKCGRCENNVSGRCSLNVVFMNGSGLCSELYAENNQPKVVQDIRGVWVNNPMAQINDVLDVESAPIENVD